MITEDYVSYETAKLLKEKGFECEKNSVTAMYNEIGKFHSLSTAAEYYYDYDDFDEYDYVAPTLQIVMKWLREVHNIALNVCYLLGMWSYSVYRTDISSSGFNSEDFDTYEEACEAGIRYCFENLI